MKIYSDKTLLYVASEEMIVGKRIAIAQSAKIDRRKKKCQTNLK